MADYNRTLNSVIIGYVLNFILFALGAFIYINNGYTTEGTFIVMASVLTFACSYLIDDLYWQVNEFVEKYEWFLRVYHGLICSAFIIPIIGYLFAAYMLITGV